MCPRCLPSLCLSSRPQEDRCHHRRVPAGSNYGFWELRNRRLSPWLRPSGDLSPSSSPLTALSPLSRPSGDMCSSSRHLGTSSHRIRVNFVKAFNLVYRQRGVNKPKTIKNTNLCGSRSYLELSSILSPGVQGRVTNIKVFV